MGKGKILASIGAKPEAATFSPDGSRLAVSSQDGSLTFYDATTLRPIGVSLPLTSAVLANIAFSRDGELLLVQDTAAMHHLVDVGQRARIGEPIAGYTGQPLLYGYGTFSPDGKTMVLPTPRGTALYDLDTSHWLRDACKLAGRSLTRAEWTHYFAAVGPYRPTCSPN